MRGIGKKNKRSILGDFDCRLRIISFLSVVFAVASLKTYIAAFAGAAFIILCIPLSGIGIGKTFGRIRYPLLFLVPLVIFLPLTSGGTVFREYSFLVIYRDGMMLSLLILIKTASILTLFSLLMFLQSFPETISALRSMKLPRKLLMLMQFTYRYIFVYLDDLRKMRSALVLRGFRNRSSLHSLRSSSGVVGSLMVRSFEQTERIYNAMILRGYDGEMPCLSEFRIRISDIFRVMFFIVTAFLLVFLDRFYVW